MEHVFICYSRKDQNLALQFKEILRKAGKDVWIDLEDLPASSIWRTEIQNAITESIAFVYLVSRNSLESEYCQKEFKFANELNKRIFPILLPGITDKDVPEIVSSRQWLTWGESNKFDINKLIRDIEKDHEWVKFITELGVNEARWKKQPDNSRLLSGKKLQETEQQLANAGSKKSPQPTDEQREYVKASRKAEQNWRKTITGIATGVFIVLCFLCALAIVGGTVAYIQSNIAATQSGIAATKELARATAQDTAFSHELAIAAQDLDTQSYDSLVLKTLLSVESLRRSSTSSLAIENIHGLNLPKKINSFPPKVSDHETTIILDSLFYGEDDKALVAGYYSDFYSTLRIWDVETGDVVYEWECPSKVASAKFSKDGNLIAISCEDDVISVVNIKDDKSTSVAYQKGEIYAFDFNTNPPRIFINKSSDVQDLWINGNTGETVELQNSQNVSFLKLSRDGTMVAGISQNDDKNIFVWDVNSGKLKWTITAKDKFYTYAFSNNSLFLVTGGDNGIGKWSLVDGTLQSTYAFDSTWYINDLKVSPDDSKIGIASSGGFASVIEVATGQQIWKTGGHNIESISFSYDSKLVATSDREGVTLVADLSTNKTVSVLTSNAKSGNGIQFSEHSQKILTNEVTSATLWDFSPLGVRYEEAYSGNIFVDSKSGIVISVSKNLLSLNHLNSSQLQDYTIDIESEPRVMAVNFEKGIISLANENGEITLRSLKDGSLLGKIENTDDIYSLSISPSGKYIASADVANVVKIWDAGSKKIVAQIHMEESDQISQGSKLNFSPNETSLLIVTSSVTAIEIPNGKHLFTIRPTDFVSSNVAYSPDGKKIAFSGKNAFNNSGSTCTYSADSGKELFCNGFSFAGVVLFSMDGKYLYQDSHDEEIIIWDTENGEVIEKFQNLSGALLSGPNSSLVVSSYDDNSNTTSIVMLDITNKTEIFRTTRDSYVTAVGFSDDLKNLVVIERNITSVDPNQSNLSIIAGWLWQSNDMIQEGCQRVYRNLTLQEWDKYLPGEPWRATCE